MRSTRIAQSLIGLAALVVGGITCYGQADINLPSASPFQPANSSGIDQINYSNSTLQLNIPLVSFKQRGKLKFDISLRYGSPVLTENQECLPQQPCTYGMAISNSQLYLSASTDVAIFVPAYVIDNEYTAGFYRALLTPDGSTHKLASIGNSLFRSEDATGWVYNESTAVLTSKDGTNYVFSPSTPGNDNLHTPTPGTLQYVEDTDGNRITLLYNSSGRVTGWIDSLGRTIPLPNAGFPTDGFVGPNGWDVFPTSSDTSSCPGTQAYTGSTEWTVPGYQGTQSFKFCFVTEQVPTYSSKTPFPANDPPAPNGYNTGSELAAVVLPDVDQNGSAESWILISAAGLLKQVVTPEGGTHSYGWGDGQLYCTKNRASVYPQTYLEQVGSQTINPNFGPTESWTYSISQGTDASGNQTITNTVEDGLGQKTVHTFTGLLQSCSYYETGTQYYDGGGNLQRTDTKTYSAQSDINVFPNQYYQMAMAVVPTTTTSQWAATSETKQTTFTYDTGFSVTNNFQDPQTASGVPYGQLVKSIASDYGAGAAGPALSTTQTTFMSTQSPAYLQANLLSQVSSVVATDNTNGQTETTNYGYDQYAVASGGAAASGWNATPIAPIRANQTSVQKYWDTTGQYLTTSATYFDTGEVQSVTDPLLHVTQYLYDPSYDAAYLTKVTNALGQSTSYGYDFESSVLTSLTDSNGVVTQNSYDGAARLTSSSTPGGPHNLASSTTYTYLSPNGIQKASLLSSSAGSESVTTTYDGLGRQTQTQRTDPEGTIMIDTTYDQLGRKSSVSMPYRSQSDTNFYGLTSYNYDLFNRPTVTQNPDGSQSTLQYAGATTLFTAESNSNQSSHTLQRMSKVDGLNRLVKVCELTQTTPVVGSESPSACGLGLAGSGFSTTYVQTLRGPITITQGLQTRTFAYDSLNQLTDATNPETGHIHYAYDNDSELISKTLPAPNSANGSGDTVTINYQQYDAIHRVHLKTYTAGSGSASAAAVAITPQVNFNYDQSAVGTLNLSDTVGRLSSEVATLNGATQAESVYSYDTDGRTGSHYQCVLQSCGTSFEDAEYDYDGVGKLTSFATPQNGYTLAYNQASHVTGVTPMWIADANHPAQLLGPIQGQVEYAPNDGLYHVSFGNGTAETYSYAPRWLTGMQVSGQQVLPATPATGAISISGTEQSKVVQVGPPTAATATATISGSVGTYLVCASGGTSCRSHYDGGTLTLTVNGFTVSATYAQGSTAASLAQALALGLSGSGSPVTATISSATITLKTVATGSAVNYALSTSGTLTEGGCNKGCHTAPDFTATLSGAAMSGGTNGTATIYDSGKITVSDGSSSAAVNFGQTSTVGSIVSALQAAIQSKIPSVTASVNGGEINVSSVQTGEATNVTLTVAVTYDSTDFSISSFAATATGLSGGANSSVGPGTVYSYAITHAPDTQVTNVTDTVIGSWNYSFDDFNRLGTAQQVNTGGTVLNGLSWDYDRYGNRWHQNNTAGTVTSNTVTFDETSNRANTVLIYDAAGNVINDGINSYVYDAENRIASVNGVSYVYDAEGRRVGKSGGTTYVVSPGGAVVDELNGSSWVRSEIAVGGHHVGTVTPAGMVFTHADWLGTERARTSMASSLCETLVSQPFGDALFKSGPTGSTCDPTPNFFTGKQRDPESSLDDFGARYFSSQWGHWMSPDWAASAEAIPYASFDNPQSFNLYAYVSNDPIDGEDPDGHNEYGSGNGLTDVENVQMGTSAASSIQTTPASQAGTAAAEEEMGLPPLVTLDANTSQQLANQTTQFVDFEAPIVKSVIQDDVNIISGVLGAMLDVLKNASGMSMGGDSSSEAGTPTAGSGPTNVPAVPSSVGPGPHAKESIPAGPSPTPTKEQQGRINKAGENGGCHTCGTKSPGTKDGHYVGDHQPPTALNPQGNPQRYYPQCLRCSQIQGGLVRDLTRGQQ